MNIFISHSILDKKIIKDLQSFIKPFRFNLFVAEHYIHLTKSVSEKIKFMIEKSDIGLIFITDNSYNSQFVQQEIGYLEALKKPYLQVIQKGYERKISGFNYGRDFMVFEKDKFELVRGSIRMLLVKYYLNKKRLIKKIAEAKRKQEEERLREQEEKAQLVLGTLAISIFVAIMSSKK